MDKSDVNRKGILFVLGSRNVYSLSILFLMWGLCILLYYFGELVDFFGWTALHWEFFYSVHDAHRLLFFMPIIYAAYVFGVKSTLTITIITLMGFLPRALFISPFPDPMLRMLVFIVIAGAVGYITAIARREYIRRNHLQAILTSERDRLLGILGRMEDGVLIMGPDYRIRFMNPSMIRDFGDVTGTFCYKSLRNRDEPCREICKLSNVLKGAIERWKYELPDGRIYEVQASPYRDSDGLDCHLAIFRNITPYKNSQTKSPE